MICDFKVKILYLVLLGSSERMAHGFGKRMINSPIGEPVETNKDADDKSPCRISIFIVIECFINY